jgi:hypothetical protein
VLRDPAPGATPFRRESGIRGRHSYRLNDRRERVCDDVPELTCETTQPLPITPCRRVAIAPGACGDLGPNQESPSAEGRRRGCSAWRHVGRPGSTPIRFETHIPGLDRHYVNLIRELVGDDVIEVT